MAQIKKLSKEREQNIIRAEFLGKLTEEQTQAVSQLRERGVLPEISPKSRRFLLKEFPNTDPTIVLGMTAQKVAKSPATRRATLETAGALLPGMGTGGRALGVLSRMGKSGAGQAGGGLLAEAFDPSEDPATRAAINFAMGFGTQGVGEGVAGAVKAVATPAGRETIVKGGERALEIVRGGGGVIPAGTISEGGFVSIMQNIAEGSFVGSSMISKALTNAQKLITEEVDKFANSLLSKTTRAEAGELIQRFIERKVDAFREAGRNSFKIIDQISEAAALQFQTVTRQVTRPARGVLNSDGTIAKITETESREVLVGGGVEISEFLAKAQDKLNSLTKGVGPVNTKAISVLRNLLKRPSRITFEEAQLVRSDLLSIGRGITETIPGRVQSVSRPLSGLMNQAMIKSARELASPEAAKAWQAANKLWREGKETFNNRVIKSLLTKDPELVVDTFVRNNSVTSINRVRKIVGPSAWKLVQSQFVRGVIAKATDPVNDVLIGRSMLSRLKTFSKESLEAVFPDAVTRKNFTDLAEAITSTQGPAGQALPGRMMIQMKQSGAATEVIGGLLAGTGFTYTGIAILTVPPVFAAILASRKLSRWMVEGLTVPAGTREGIIAFSKVSAALVRRELEE